MSTAPYVSIASWKRDSWSSQFTTLHLVATAFLRWGGGTGTEIIASEVESQNDAPAIFSNGRNHLLCPAYIQIANHHFGTEQQILLWSLELGLVRLTRASRKSRPPPCRYRSRPLRDIPIPCSNDTYMQRSECITYP